MGKRQRLVIDTSAGPIALRYSEGKIGQIILIHGNSLSSESFRHQMTGPIGNRFAMAAFDLPGHGDSPRPRDPKATYSLPSYASVLAEVCASLGWDNPVLIGHSLGGHIALQAGSRGLCARAVMAIGTPPLGLPLAFDEAFSHGDADELLFKGELDPQEALSFARSFTDGTSEPPPYFVQSIAATDPAARSTLGASFEAGGLGDEREYLASFDGPAALVLGERDRVVNRSYVASITAKRQWGGSLMIIPGASHCPQYDSYDAFNTLLETFLLDAYADS